MIMDEMSEADKTNNSTRNLKYFSASDAHNFGLLLPYGTGYLRAGTKSISLQETFDKMKRVVIPVLECIIGRRTVS
jgi:hypothetical protein